ncbi:hypothetical protein ACGFIG_09460 [Micromonospora sp. NPDC049048]|uniref:hypothetical protein n=1 Tax=Micromonospora sp. NPDC049048 TaxID=3364263 RepID=UPI003723044A
MTAVDAPTAQQPTAAPAPIQGPAPAGRYIGRHRADRNEPRHTRHVIADPVPVSYRLSPAAQQLVTATSDKVPASPADATGLLDMRHAWTTPAVLADLRDDLTRTDDTEGTTHA